MRNRRLLKILAGLKTEAHTSFKPVKPRYLLLKKGKVRSKFSSLISYSQMPFVSEKPEKSIGKVFSISLKDVASIHETIKVLET